MFFAEYIQILRRHCDCIGNQERFTEEFVIHASRKYKKDDRTPNAFQNYYNGETYGRGKQKRIIGDKIGSFATEYLQKKDLDCRALDEYLAKLIKKTDAACQLSSEFEKEFLELPIIDKGTASVSTGDNPISDDHGDIISPEIVQLAKKLRALFVKVIDKVIVDYNLKRRGKLVPPEDDEPDPLQKEKVELIQLLKQLVKRFNKLRGDYLKFEVAYSTATKEEKKNNEDILTKDYKNFKELNEMLFHYKSLFPEINELFELYDVGNLLVILNSRPGNSASLLPEGTWDHYGMLLVQVSETISKSTEISS